MQRPSHITWKSFGSKRKLKKTQNISSTKQTDPVFLFSFFAKPRHVSERKLLLNFKIVLCNASTVVAAEIIHRQNECDDEGKSKKILMKYMWNG